MPDKPNHRTFADRAEQRARTYPMTTDKGETLALLAIYHLLEERLPRTKPPGDLSDVVDIRPGSQFVRQFEHHARCTAITAKGGRCKREVAFDSAIWCSQHLTLDLKKGGET